MFTVSFFASIFFVADAMHMATGAADCPFMLHEETLCAMGALDHANAWKAAYSALMPSFMVLLIVAVLLSSPLRPFSCLLRHRSAVYYFARAYLEQVYSFFLRPLQEFFARGILHPKLF